MKTKAVTYNDYKKFSGESDLDISEVIDLFKSMNWDKNSFLYFPITNINLFQIIFHKENQFIIEITNDSEMMIYHQKYVSQQECEELINNLFEQDVLNSKILSNFYKVPIMTKTLDEIMKGE